MTASDGTGEKIQVSSEAALALRWGRGGRELLYLTFDGRLFSVPVTTAGGGIRLGKDRLDFRVPKDAPWNTFEVAPDGDRILAVVVESSGDERPATVVLNWQALLPH